VRAGFAKVEGKLDALTTLAETEFTLSAHVKESVEAAQRTEAGNKAVLVCLLHVLAKAPSTCTAGKAENATEGQDEDVEAQLWAERAQEFLRDHTDRLQAAELKRADQLSSMKEEILEAFRTAVEQVQEDTLKKLKDRERTHSAAAIDALKQALSDELAQLQHSITEGQEVQRTALEQLAARVDTSAPTELHRELQNIRQELQVVRTVQNNTLYGVYDVPLLPVIARYESESVLDAVKGLAYETWTLHFACPVCAQPAPSGPKSKGYQLQATHAWVRRVNKAVALGLKALSVMSLLGPVPLPGLGKLADYLPTGSFNKLTKGAENTLKTAQEGLEKMQEGLQKLEDAVNTSAETMGQLSAATAALRPVVVDLDYVQTIREILLALKESPPALQYTGLVRATCRKKGECAWVCKIGACKAHFELEGVACQKIQMEFA
jgi:Sec-independent protein translocase protein TatA